MPFRRFGKKKTIGTYIVKGCALSRAPKLLWLKEELNDHEVAFVPPGRSHCFCSLFFS